MRRSSVVHNVTATVLWDDIIIICCCYQSRLLMIVCIYIFSSAENTDNSIMIY